jgi:hypothetical protein
MDIEQDTVLFRTVYDTFEVSPEDTDTIYSAT